MSGRERGFIHMLRIRVLKIILVVGGTTAIQCLGQHQIPCWPKAMQSPEPTSWIAIVPDPSLADDSFRIQQAIYAATGGVSFKPGRYNLKRPVCLQPYRSYVGGGAGT
jgi:hypothetical protein